MAHKTPPPYVTLLEHRWACITCRGQVAGAIIILCLVADAAFGIFGGHFANGIKNIGSF